MPFSRPSSRLRRVATATGALALAATLALSAAIGGGVELTDAAWNDTEVAEASVKASFPSATDSWVRSTSNSFSNYAAYKPSRSPASFIVPRTVDRPANDPVSRQMSGTERDDYTTGNNFGIRTLGTRSGTALNYCGQANKDPSPLLPATYDECTGGSAFTDQYSMARSKGYGTSGGFAHPGPSLTEDILIVEAQNVRTMAECSPTGESKALAPSAAASWGGNPDEPYGRGDGIGLLFTNIFGVATQPNSYFSVLEVPSPNERITRWMKPLRTTAAGIYYPGRVFFRATITARQFATYGYALSDLYVTIDQYTTDSNHPYTGSFTLILSRSECGITSPAVEHLKLANVFEPRWQTPATSVPAYPSNPSSLPATSSKAPLPRRNGSLAYPRDSDYQTVSASNYHVGASFSGQSESEKLSPHGMRGGEVAANLPPITTLTSPLENVTAAETTISTAPTATAAPTSAAGPPVTQATSSTSAASATAGPDAPGPLSPTARMEDVGIVEVGGEALVVVVTGATVPPDAPQGAGALDRWLTDGIEPGGEWTGFSGTQEEDGWRWAAVNRSTGTVLYIR